tara:strand:+ start:735 stop:1826 length:1092 start_codon:yes stop_codon:yes gene_type:complete
MDENLREIYKLNYEEKCSKYPDISQKDVLPAVKRIIVIGDLHGDWDETIKSLKIPNLIDDNLNWIGGKTVVVQIGDQIDRCRQLPCNRPIKDDENSDIKILKFFTNLHSQALKAGGAIYSIIGNHELMNSTGRMEYVSYKNYMEFEKKKENKEFLNDMPKNLKNIDAREWAFKPGNPIAEFVACTRKLALIIGNNLFVHAGIVPEIAKKYPDIGDLNKLLSLYLWDQLENPELYQDIFGPDVVKGQTIINSSNRKHDFFKISPLWNRKYGNLKNNNQNCQILNPVKKIYQVNRMYVGHTPQIYKGINSICNGDLWYTDVGVSKAFDIADSSCTVTGKRSNLREAQVLEIIDDGEPRILRDGTM